MRYFVECYQTLERNQKHSNTLMYLGGNSNGFNIKGCLECLIKALEIELLFVTDWQIRNLDLTEGNK